MAFSKKFPRTIEGSNYPQWEEIKLTPEEEKKVEKSCKEESILLMKECLKEAKNIMSEEELKGYQSDQIKIAIALFEKIASHSVYWKESKAKEKFDELY
jgi:hypothetical protein